MGSDVLILSRIYLYSSYFDSMVGTQHSKRNVVNWLHWHYTMWFLYSVDLYNRLQCKKHVVQLRQFWYFWNVKVTYYIMSLKAKAFSQYHICHPLQTLVFIVIHGSIGSGQLSSHHVCTRGRSRAYTLLHIRRLYTHVCLNPSPKLLLSQFKVNDG